MLPVVLYVNHREQNCGVHQFGKRIFHQAMQSTKYDSFYIHIDDINDLYHWVTTLNPSIVVYNYYSSSTMPWLTPDMVRAYRTQFSIKQLALYHEGAIEHMGFDLLLSQDPTFEAREGYVALSRPIPHYKGCSVEPPIPTFGSFGFGLDGKGFTRLVDNVSRHYTEACIRLNIPYAAFGDSDGSGARRWSDQCRVLCHKGIDLTITHDLMPETDLLDWLAQNTINCFLYDEHYGRGISGTTDYALAVHRPIAISKSWQFKHLWTIDDSFCVENNSLHTIIAMGTEHLDAFHERWSDAALIHCFEQTFDDLLGG